MSTPRVDIVPLRPAVKSDSPTTLDVLLAITPPEDTLTQRPPMNIGLVLDRSGSMAEAKKMSFAREAAVFLVQQLKRNDRFSFTVFDEQIETLVPSRPVENTSSLVSLINAVQPRGSTDLFAGWAEGGKQVRENKIANGTNRVILLSDGQANHGETNPDVMAGAAKALSQAGVSTTTMGVGDSYNEDLLEKIAEHGDGNYYYISSPVQLMDIFQSELKELVGIAGTSVTLRVKLPEAATGLDVLNDFLKNGDGAYQLPNLIGGATTNVLVRFTVPAQAAESEIARFVLEWDNPKKAGRQTLELALKLPAITTDAYMKLAEDVTVSDQVSVLQIARLKREAMSHMDRGDMHGTAALVQDMDAMVCAMPPASLTRAGETEDLEEIKKLLASGDKDKLRKTASVQSNYARRSKP
ncbi:vWA domain-containing protein [Zavarzinella formosa]|uniref:vWA domain-containing protein n=1 Tax=Zavarzinella formosa TaxID=360055 RepID=UPI0002FAA5B7|nr:VWA domain-containing protein [Zavarzinella formosa]